MPQYQYPPMQQYPQDQIEQYGSIIKDLTDTEKLLDQLRMTILGLQMVDGKEVKTRKEVRIDEDAVHEFLNLVRGVVNQNTHFSRYDDATVESILKALNYHTNRFLMLQGARIPIRYRANIATQAMALCTGSLYKAKEGNILRWTKGSFMESKTANDSFASEKKGFLSFLFPGKKK